MPIPQAAARPTTAGEYRNVVGALARRAARLGSRDPEAAAQECVRRSLSHALSGPAIEFYFGEELMAAAEPPAWTLTQLLAWLHGVLRFVVSEERARRGHREVAMPIDELPDVADRSSSQLDSVIDAELRGIVRECVMRLTGQPRAALLLRLQGAKYEEIAGRLGVSANTIATWLRRSSAELVVDVRARMDGRPRTSGAFSGEPATVSHA